jgi:hypothetical protein
MMVSFLAYSSILNLSGHLPPKHRSTFTGLHGVMSQTTEVFITIGLSPSGPKRIEFNRQILFLNQTRKSTE